jgi:NAD(P)-dependent dehydrogenase (short-subunit alcohol dehydrogenase family)
VIEFGNVQAIASRGEDHLLATKLTSSDPAREWRGDLLKGRTAIVTGAGAQGSSLGIGRAAALQLARQGARVAALDKSSAAAQATADMIIAEGGEAMALCADATDKEAVEKRFAEATGKLGPIAILVNSVGQGSPGGLLDTSAEEWKASLDRNLTSAFICSQAAVPLMLQDAGASIVHVGSIFGIRYPGSNFLAYSVAKAAMIHLSKSIALQFAARNIRSNIVLPGAVDTPAIRNRISSKWGKDEVDRIMAARDHVVPRGVSASVWDVASAVCFLASPLASHITGTELVIDGGASATTVPSYASAAQAQKSGQN